MAISKEVQEIYRAGFDAIRTAPTKSGQQALVDLTNELVRKQVETEKVAK